MKNYLQAVRVAFSRELVRHLAARLGEPENAVGKALKGMVPMVLCQLIIRSGEGAGRALLAPLLQAGGPVGREIRGLTAVLALLGSSPDHHAAPDAGEALLGRAFGLARPGLDASLGTYAGLRPGSAGVLLRLVAAVVGAELAQYAVQQGLTAMRLGEELGTIKSQVYSWLPADLPRWPGFRGRTAVRASQAVWAAALARPYWVLVLAAAGTAVLGLLVLSALARPVARLALVVGHRTGASAVDSTAATREAGIRPGPATW